jgi:UPF0755 protein
MTWRERLFVAFLLLVLFSPGLFWARQELLDQAADPAGQPRLVEIPKGSGIQATAEILAQAGVINPPWLFVLASRLTMDTALIQAGEYQLSAAMSRREILQALAKGRVFLHPLVIPEGQTLAQIMERIAESRLADPAQAAALAHDRDFIASLGLEGDSLEGYLFPDTYRFARGAGAKAILAAMARRFQEQWQPLAARAARLGLSRRTTVTLASIIEREARVPSERPLVSAVYHNRLKINMPLQADPTVSYGVADFEGRLTRRHLETDHPYNTYTRPGLPPGPICSPGLASLQAALNPAPVDYLYFVAVGDGSHAFSRDYRDQINNVNRYQRGK